MRIIYYVFFQLFLCLHFSNTLDIYNVNYTDDTKMDMLVDIVMNNFKGNGWINLLFIGDLSDRFYNRIKHLPMTISHSKIYEEDQYIDDAVPYHSNIIIITCSNVEEFETSLKKALDSPYWHPLSNIIVYFRAPCETLNLAEVFFTLWYYKGINTIIILEDNFRSTLRIYYFSPYISDEYKLQYEFGCSTALKVGMPVKSFKNFVCVEGCHNVSLHSVLRAKYLGTCIGVSTYSINYGDRNLTTLKLFGDKVKDMHGFIFTAFITEVPPFLRIREYPNGTVEIYERDASIWKTMAQLMNFKIDLTAAKEAMTDHFGFDQNVQKVFEFTQRKADLILIPIYQFDLIIAKLDNTFPFMESGVCFMSYRAPFETFLFDVRRLQRSIPSLIEFTVCFICIWFVFFAYNIREGIRFKLDQLGKDFMNVLRLVLSASLYNPPKRHLFRLFLVITIWCFFIINFTTQAHIISLFSSSKRGKNVDTFNDIIEKGYNIEGLGSPDVFLPDDEEIFRKINEKLISKQDMFECIRNMQNDSKRFCLMDCALARYLELNLLNEKGEQYLHVAREDRMHSLYLNMILHQHSPLLENYNKYMMALFEGGIVRKWMEFRYKVIGEEVPFKALAMSDLVGIFQTYMASVSFSFAVFIFEIFIGNFTKIKVTWKLLMLRWNVCFKICANSVLRRKQRTEMATQTNEYKDFDYSY